MDNSYFIRLLRNVMSKTQTNKQQLYSSLNIPKEQIDNLLIGMDGASVSVLFKVIRFMKYRMVLRPTSRQCYKAESYNDLIRLLQEHCSQHGSFQNLTLQQFSDIAFGWRIALEKYKPTPVVVSRLTKRKPKPQPKPFIQSQPQRPVTVNASKSPSVYDDGTWYCVFCGKPVRGKYEKRQIHINEHGVRLVD